MNINSIATDKNCFSRKWEFQIAGKEPKSIEIVHGDMCELQDSCDIAVCSAFKGAYYPTVGSMIYSLYTRKGINVQRLSTKPELDLKNLGCWLSRETGKKYKRVACIELTSYYDNRAAKGYNDKVIQRGFSNLRYLIEQASICNIPVGTIAMPLIGAGYQRLELEYILGPMITQCRRVIECEENVKHIIIYERNIFKAKRVAEAFENVFTNTYRSPDVFVSYSTKQTAEAQNIFNFLSGRQVSCWMAPLSIPAGSDYLDEIPAAISNMKTMLVVLTEDAEKSRWVEKEISSAIGANKNILPYMPHEYKVGKKFSFLLDGEQFFPGYIRCTHNYDALYDRVIKLNE